MDARAKIFSRLSKILRRAQSKNENEAANARQRADELIRKYGITPAEVAAVERADAPKKYVPVGAARATWQERVALAVAQARECRARKSRDWLVFEGAEADQAAALYQHIIEDIKREAAWHFAACGYVHMSAFRAVWDEIFSSEASRAILDPDSPEIPLATHGASVAEIEKAIGASPIDQHIRSSVIGIFFQNANNSGRRYGRSLSLARHHDPVPRPGAPGSRPPFACLPGLILASSSEPGNHATLFLDGKRLPFRGYLSMFDDEARDYTWVFECPTEPPSGAHVVFSTADRHVVGKMSAGGELGVDTRARAHVTRNSQTGESLEVAVLTPRVLVLVLSALTPPYGKMLDAQRRTWASSEVDGAEVRFYFPGSLADGASALREELARALADDATWTHLFRTNSSSYVDLARLVEVASDLPLDRVYAGIDGGGFASGSGFFISRDATELLAQELPRGPVDVPDDVACGAVLSRAGLAVVSLPRVDYWIKRALAEVRRDLDGFVARVREAHHVRVKHATDRALDLAAMEEVHRMKHGEAQAETETPPQSRVELRLVGS